MSGQQFNKIQIHLADNRSDAAVLKYVNVPARLTDWSLTSSKACFGRQAAILRENAIDRVTVEPPFLRNEKKIGTRIVWTLLQPSPQSRQFIHARASSHPKERLG